MVVTTAKKMNAGHPAKKNQKKESGESTTSSPSTTTAMELSEEARLTISELQALSEDAQRDLAAVLPALQTAVRALTLLKKQDIVELQAISWNSPSQPWVKSTMEAVCVMFRLEPVLRKVEEEEVRDYSDAAKKLLSDPKFLTLLMNYDKDNISEATIQQIAPYLDMEGFEPAVVRRSSVACGAFCGWVRAMYKYHMARKEIAPKRERLRQLRERLVELRGGTKKEPVIATPEETPPPTPALPDHGRLLLGDAHLQQEGEEF